MFPGATEAHALPFATTNYEADEDGTLHSVLPSRCVYATGEQTCAIFVDHYRKRKTGPCFAALLGGRRGRGPGAGRMARGGRGTPRCRRRRCRPGRSPGAHQRAYPATLARGLLLLLSALGGPLPTIATFHILS